jgi:hypothetical protein
VSSAQEEAEQAFLLGNGERPYSQFLSRLVKNTSLDCSPVARIMGKLVHRPVFLRDVICILNINKLKGFQFLSPARNTLLNIIWMMQADSVLESVGVM